MPAVQEDILKLTAQFVARNGPVFQNGLMAREGNVRDLSLAHSFVIFAYILSLEPAVWFPAPVSPLASLFQSARSAIH